MREISSKHYNNLKAQSTNGVKWFQVQCILLGFFEQRLGQMVSQPSQARPRLKVDHPFSTNTTIISSKASSDAFLSASMFMSFRIQFSTKHPC